VLRSVDNELGGDVPDLDVSRRIVYRVDGMPKANVQRGIVYKHDHQPLLMDVYRPEETEPSSRWPAILFIPGGPVPRETLPPREWGVFQSYGELAAASECVGVVFNHRLHGLTDYEQAQADVTAAITHVRDHADELCIDSNRLALWTFSGGGTLLSESLRERPPYIRCLLAFYPVLDLRLFIGPFADQRREESAVRLSPAAHLDGASVPMFVAQAGQDTAAINASIDAFVRTASLVNVPMEVVCLPAAHHAFDVIDDEDWSRQTIRQAVAFARTYLTSVDVPQHIVP
jgi:acetyl esterase/lipase